MNGPWSIIIEYTDGRLSLVRTFVRHSAAVQFAHELAELHKGQTGTKIHIRTPDTADQLQLTSKGEALRDQSHLPAVGEDLTVLAPTAKATIKRGQ